VSLWVASSSCSGAVLVECAVLEHREQDVDPAAGQADEGGVVAFALGAFAVVVGPGGGVVQGGERGQEQGPLEVLVAAVGWVLAAEGGS
jgi:hypothetical protein